MDLWFLPRSKDSSFTSYVVLTIASIQEVQMKGRFTVDKKYIGKDIFIAFLESDSVKIYNHDAVIMDLSENITSSKSWKQNGLYHWGQTPLRYDSLVYTL